MAFTDQSGKKVSDFLSSFLSKCKPGDQPDMVLNMLLRFIIETDATIPEDIRSTYKVLKHLINAEFDHPEVRQNPQSVGLIMESYNEVLEEMASVEICEDSLKSMITTEGFDLY